MKRIWTFIPCVLLGGLASGALAETPTSPDQAAFQQLFRSWQKSAPKSRSTAHRPLAPRTVARTRIDGLTISSPMGDRVNPITGRRMLHAGADLAAPMGSVVHATADGVVMRAGPTGSYGLLVTVRHPGGYETRYAHMSHISVTPGEQVRKGDPIGRVGSTGRSTGPHLHYEIRRLGQAIDPVPSMGR